MDPESKADSDSSTGDHAVEAVVVQFAWQCRADAALLVCRERAGEAATARAAWGLAPSTVRALRIADGDELIGRAFDGREPALRMLDDREGDWLERFGIPATRVLHAPLAYGETARGVLLASYFIRPADDEARLIATAEDYAAMAAACLHNESRLDGARSA